MKKALLVLLFFSSLIIHAQQQFTVYFDFDVDETSSLSSLKLDDWIKNNKDVSVVKIYGYADKTGDSLYNIDLSERRAAYTYKKLQEGNVDVTGTEQKGFGESQSTAVRSAKDRKVVVYYTIPEPKVVVVPKKPEPTAFAKKVTTAVKGDKIKIPNLNFYNNSDIVLPQSRPILEDLLSILKDNPNLKIDIQGHICCQKVEENQISLRRAKTVYFFLVQNGIDKDRLTYKSFGSSVPIYKLPEKSEEEKVANRRVEIEIIQK
ncbi:OmpA family protein [Flavobacterium psychrotrophum]|uniref:OmpA family protein n=1 Tax=Flavobacterium psychrotrophum TaxID=2294119 RepID=UPI000E30F665|nr:OmpA family protein [Flavobacterium psychrotrophum]